MSSINYVGGACSCSFALYCVCMLQESSLGLLCSMARLPFYRPSIRKAEPAVVIAEMLAAGCREVCFQLLNTTKRICAKLCTTSHGMLSLV